MSAVSASGAITETEPRGGSASPVRGSRMWEKRRPSTANVFSEPELVELTRDADTPRPEIAQAKRMVQK